MTNDTVRRPEIDDLTRQRLDRLRKYAEWEKENRPDPRQHILDWAADEIERLSALSHAEGEAVPVAWGLKWPEDVGVNPHTVFRTESHAQAYRAECQSADTIMIVPLYTHPAPQVAVPVAGRVCVNPGARNLVYQFYDSFELAKAAAAYKSGEPDGVFTAEPLYTLPAPQVAVPEQRDDMIPEHFNVDECRGFRTGYNHLHDLIRAAPTAPAGEAAPWPAPQEATTIEEYVSEYEYTDGEGHNYSPTETERVLILDAIHGIPDHLLCSPPPRREGG